MIPFLRSALFAMLFAACALLAGLQIEQAFAPAFLPFMHAIAAASRAP